MWDLFKQCAFYYLSVKATEYMFIFLATLWYALKTVGMEKSCRYSNLSTNQETSWKGAQCYSPPVPCLSTIK